MYPMQVTLTLQNAQQFNLLAAIIGGNQVVGASAAIGVDCEDTVKAVAGNAKPEAKPEKKPAAKAAEASAESAKAATAPKTEASPPAGTAAAASSTASRSQDLGAEGDKIAVLDYPAVSKAITDSVKTKGRDAVVSTLNAFGAAKGTDLKAEQYAEFVEALAALPNVGA